jgi:RNA polymerase sigma factor (sigma-70 family)
MKLSEISDDLETLFVAGALGQLSDAELLARFNTRDEALGSEAAFSELLARHASMVMGVCTRMVGDSQSAADAFQAVFLVLVRKASVVRVENSLGRWLYGVSVRVARRARRRALRARSRERNLEGFDWAGGAPASEECERGELRSLIDEEIARLPGRFRSAVELCYLEGLTQEQAAGRLRCPIGTVESRLHRAKERLRSRLARRGVAPLASVGAWLSGETARAYVPPRLAAETTAAAIRCATNKALGNVVPAGVSSLVHETIWSMMMIKGWQIGLVLLAIGLPTAGAVAMQRAGDDTTVATPKAPAVTVNGAGTEPSMADRFARILSEYYAKQAAISQALQKVTTQREVNEVYAKMSPDEVAFTRRMIDLANSAPTDPVARDALIWVVNKRGMFDVGQYGDEFARAAALLVRHHGNDPEAVRVGLGLDNIVSHHHDALLFGFYAAAKGHEAKGLARLALAQYLEEQAMFAVASRQLPGRQKKRFIGVMGDDDKVHDKEVEQSDEEYSYTLELRTRDAGEIRALAERLCSEVIAEYGDVVYRTVEHRELEAVLASQEPRWKGKLLTDDELAKIKALVGSKQTLAEAASARLDNMQNLIEGKPAPEIDGVDFHGKPLKLSDYRGKVVVLVFWGTWCGPCMREIPHERELAERLKDKPFAVLGVNCDDDKEAAVSAIKSERITWPNWHDGGPGAGPIAKRYHIRSYPTLFVIDGQGIIRHKEIIGEGLDKAVDQLMKETPPAGGRG